MNALDPTHDPSAQSWVASANAPDIDFPIQNLPFALPCSTAAGTAPFRCCLIRSRGAT